MSEDTSSSKKNYAELFKYTIQSFGYFQQHRSLDYSIAKEFTDEHYTCMCSIDDIDDEIVKAYPRAMLYDRIEFWEVVFPYEHMIKWIDLFMQVCSDPDIVEQYMFGLVYVHLYKAELYRAIVKWNKLNKPRDYSDLATFFRIKSDLHAEMCDRHERSIQFINKLMVKSKFSERIRHLVDKNEVLLYVDEEAREEAMR